MKRQMLSSKCWSLLAVLVVSLCTVFIAACGSSSHEDKGSVSINISNLSPVLDKDADEPSEDASQITKVVADFYEAKDNKKASDTPTFSQTKEVAENQDSVTFSSIACKTYYIVAKLYLKDSSTAIMSPSYIVTVKANNVVTAQYPIASKLELNIDKTAINVGESTACQAILTLVDDTQIYGDKLVEWSLTDSSVGTLSYDEENNTEIFTGKKAGSTNVTANYDYDIGMSMRSSTITVTEGE